LHRLEYRLRLFSSAHQDDAFDGVVFVVEAELPKTRRTPDYDFSDILDQHRRPIVHSEHYVADVLWSRETSQSAHVIELPALGVESAAGITIVRS